MPELEPSAPISRALPDVPDVLEYMSDAFFALDSNWHFSYLNRKAEGLLERSRADLIGTCIWDEFPELVTTPLYDRFHTVLDDRLPLVFDEFYAPLFRWYSIRAVPMRNGVCAYFADVTDQKLAEKVRQQISVTLEQQVKERTAQLEKVNEQLLHDTFHDTLTGLPNRRLFMDRLEQVVKRGADDGDAAFTVLFLDFDRFKVVNDSLSHAVGDALLIMAGEILETCVRPVDMVARLSADEFVILLEGTSQLQHVIMVTERIQKRLAQPLHLHGHEVCISSSIGVVIADRPYDNATEVIRDAELAMYRAKSEGKGRYALFDISMRERALALMAMESDLRLAIERGQLRLNYQPIIDTRTEQLKGVETLVRWHHPKHGLISPAEFIPLAEQTGLIFELDRWVLREACQQFRSWQQEFPHHPPLTLSVNISSQQLTQPDLAQHVQDILAHTHFKPYNLNLELTETVLANDTAVVQRNIQAIRHHGINLHLDDFGTGYSSLGYLQRFPAHSIKIDRSFTARILQAEGAELIRTMIIMAHNLGMKVVAEGVETTEQFLKLREMSCEYTQGFLFSKPVEPKEIRIWIAQACAYASLE
jgi:diguanylate cyclase (GGDEF)-like protein